MVKKKPACIVGDTGEAGLISGSGISSGEGNGNPFQYSCLGNCYLKKKKMLFGPKIAKKKKKKRQNH